MRRCLVVHTIRAKARARADLVADLEGLERLQPTAPEIVASMARALGRSRTVVALARGCQLGMVCGMATTKVTITLDDQQLKAVRELVASGKAKNLSQFVKHAVAISLADVAGWGAMLGAALEETGGPLTRKERTWADAILGTRRRQKRDRRAA